MVCSGAGGGYCFTRYITLSALAFALPATLVGSLIGWARGKKAQGIAPGFTSKDWFFRGAVLFGIGWMIFSTGYTLYMPHIIDSTFLHEAIGYLTMAVSAAYILLAGLYILVAAALSVGK